MRLKNKVALITGGGTGVGYGTAQAFSKEGAQVIITGRRAEKLKSACDQIKGDPSVQFFQLDIGNREQVNEVVEKILKEFGHIDILVNNAGINVTTRSMEEVSPEDWDHLMTVNATGSFNTIKAVLPGMKERGDGVIISISSIAGCRPSPLAGVGYTASKHAMTALTRTVSEELIGTGIRVTVISPGEINTPILDMRPVKVSDEQKAKILQPEDMAAAILFVATLPPRAHIPELIIKPTIHSFK